MSGRVREMETEVAEPQGVVAVSCKLRCMCEGSSEQSAHVEPLRAAYFVGALSCLCILPQPSEED